MSTTEPQNTQYAVIREQYTGRTAECFPLAYQDEDALRSVIAGSSILACGIASHEEAVALVQDMYSGANVTNGLPNALACEPARLKLNLNSKTTEGKTAFGPQSVWVAAREWARQAIAAAVLVTCSKNVFGGLLRILIGI